MKKHYLRFAQMRDPKDQQDGETVTDELVDDTIASDEEGDDDAEE